MAERSFLVQRFAKIQVGAYHVIGYSVAGEDFYLLQVRVASPARKMPILSGATT